MNFESVAGPQEHISNEIINQNTIIQLDQISKKLRKLKVE